jgi:hypothetical protein
LALLCSAPHLRNNLLRENSSQQEFQNDETATAI